MTLFRKDMILVSGVILENPCAGSMSKARRSEYNFRGGFLYGE